MQQQNRRRRTWADFACAAALAVTIGGVVGADDDKTGLPFHEAFKDKLDPNWKWVREDPKAWRTTDNGLEVLIQPGNMWGPANDAKNVLVRPVPDPTQTPVQITAAVANKPTGQWEQVDLVWYYDDSHMVKIGQEMVDGQLSIVMGREQADRARTINIIPIDAEHVELRLTVKGDRIRGQFKTPGADWREAGETDLPIPANGKPHVSLQFYNGVPNAGRWARVREVTIRAVQ